MKSVIITKHKQALVFLILLLSMVFSTSEIKSENLKQIINLKGTWRFSIGDNPDWKDVDFNPNNWDYVSLPQRWEDAGYINYDGFAWYRKSFRYESDINRSDLLLVLGYIDDVDEVYFNGQLLGKTGVFPPVVKTSFTQLRKYHLPVDLINLEGENIIAIRVYDEYETGGLYKGPIGIYYDEDKELLLKDLSGRWKIETENILDEDNSEHPVFIYVPGHLESRGFHGFGGNLSLSRNFTIEDGFNKEDLIIVLGYIDADEKVYLNDRFIGTVDDIRNSSERDSPPGNILRGYRIESNFLLKGNNKITIVIKNNNGGGGIVDGPIGIIRNHDFNTLRKRQEKKPVDYWEEFIKNLWE